MEIAKKLISLVISTALVLFLCSTSVAAGSKEEKSARLAERVKAGVTKLGTGPSARIEVKLKDKTKLEGYVSETTDDHFVVVDDKTGSAITVAYPQVTQVKGNNLSTGAKIAIGVGIVIFIIAVAVAMARSNG